MSRFRRSARAQLHDNASGIPLAERAGVKHSWIFLFAVGCGDHGAAPADAIPDAVDEFAPQCRSFTTGPHDQLCFSLDLSPTDGIIAQRSTPSLFGFARTGAVVASATSETAGMFTFGAITLGDASEDPRSFILPVTGVAAGDGEVVVRDAAGNELDRVTLHVRASDELALDGDLSTAPLVLAGEITTLHVTTKTAGQVTHGSGAVQFTPSGGVVAADRTDAPWLTAGGDTGFFRIGASGAIAADAPDATASVSVTAVPASALTAITADHTTLSFAHGDDAVVAIGATASGTPVYGPRCTWSNNAGLAIDLTHSIFDPANGGLGKAAVYHYKIESDTAGNYQPVCTLPGGLTVTLQVHVS